MKKRIAITTNLFLLSFIISLCSIDIPCYASGEPILGIDITVKKRPKGTIISQTKTDKNGRFEITGLTKGSYTLEYTAPKNNSYKESKSNSAGIAANNNYQSSKSNSARIIAKDGTEHITINIELMTVSGSKGKDKFDPITFDITRDKGRIKGEIVSNFGVPQEPGVR